MKGRWGNPSAFRADPNAAPATRPSRRQTVALLATVVLVAGAVALASYLIHPGKARAFDLFHGSIFVSDQNSPVAVDLAMGKPTLRLAGADQQVGIKTGQTMAVVPLDGNTLLLNQATGEFNMVDNSGFVVKHDGGGVPLVRRAGDSTSFGIASRNGQAYIVRTGPTGGTDVYLVGQPTVESAINASGSVRPRASDSISEEVSTAPGGAASANGNLWLLAGPPGGERTIRELSVPPGSSSGAALNPSDHGQVGGPAAIGTATAGADGSGADVVGVASPTRITLFAPGANRMSANYRAPGRVDKILPASTGQGRLAFLMHGSAGWYLVSIGADGSGLRPPKLLPTRTLPTTATLAEPAASEGRLYTIDKSTGELYQIGYDGTVELVPGRSTYPLVTRVGAHGKVHPVETTDFVDAYAVARGPRVIFDSATHDKALMVFTDGSHPPRVIVKSAAVRVNAAGGAEALTRSTVPPGRPGTKPGKAQPRPAQQVAPINDKLNCKTLRQKPHIPVITSAVAGSRTVALTWNYPIISVEDCYPSTYVVSLQKISANAPQAPGSVKVQGQTGYTITGLFPSTRYRVTVTAYINDVGTTSVADEFVTGPEGPAAPTNLKVGADSSGNWQLSWDSCGTVAQGCVPAQSWTITPSFCDGRGVSSPPQAITVTGDPTSKRQPPATYPARDDLLGRGLQFQVQGSGDQGQAGTPSAKSPCIYSWTPPVAGDLSVQASSPPPTAGGLATTTTVATVKFARGQVHDLGGVGGTLTYELLSGHTVVDRVGPTTDPSVRLRGIRAAQSYQVRVLASPPRHSNVVVPIGPVSVVPAIAHWPTVLVNNPRFDAPPGLTGTLHVSFAFPAGTDTRGERFDLVNSQMTCGGGNAAMPLTGADVGPGQDMTYSVDRTQFNGPCTVTIQLAQNQGTETSPPLYGAGSMSKRVTSGSFQVPPPSINSAQNDFAAQWGGATGHPNVLVTYHGSDNLAAARNWQIFVTNDGGTTHCGSAFGNAPPVSIDVDKSCVKSGGNFQVDIQYDYYLQHAHFVVDVNGQAPQPVDLTKIDFSAAWDDNAQRPHIVLDFTYNGSSDLSALAPLDFTETVTSSGSPGVTCAQVQQNPANTTVRIGNVLTACPAIPDSSGTPPVYTVDVSVNDPNYDQSRDWSHTVPNQPPAQ